MIFDDNATRDIFDSTTTGTNGNTAAGTGYIGYFRPEQTEDTGKTWRSLSSRWMAISTELGHW